uniref:ribosomal RNA processing protein 1 homolog B n=1 Tax=Panthera onca TaxID=9690 RepID=UPI00295579A3|nr:ribosomal RNA processing protein 1 homolog B [Panthera onca]
MAPAMQPAELQFAQRLASHEKGIRDRAVKKLRQYISVKTQRETGGFSQEELLKIWKGLFYCMWVQDEPLLQKQLANVLLELIHLLFTAEHLFIQTFWQTMNREWKGIDRLRLGKYYMLIRLVLRQSFEVLKRNGWEESRIKLFLDVLMKEILHPESQSPDGVKFHFIGIYLDELSKVGGRELLADQNLRFIDPFCKVAAKTKDQTLVQTIARGVLEVIVDQSPLGPEETLEEQKPQVGEGEPSEEETPENEVVWRQTVSRKKTALSQQRSGMDGVRDDGARGGGRLEDAGPLLQFDYKAVADRLLEITNRKNTPPFNRKRLSKLIKKFRDLSEAGSLSRLSFAEDISAEGDDRTLNRGKHKKKGNKLLEKSDPEEEGGNKSFLAEEEESEGSVQKRKGKKRRKVHLQPEHLGSGAPALPPEQNGGGEPEGSPGRAQKMPAAEPGAPAAPRPQEHSVSGPAPAQGKRKRPRKRSLRVQGESSESTPPLPRGDEAQEPSPPAPPASGAPVQKRQRTLGALPINGSGPPALAWPPPQQQGRPAGLPPGRRLKKQKGEPSGLDLCDPSHQKAAILKKRKKVKETCDLERRGGLKAEARLVQALVRQPSRGRWGTRPASRKCVALLSPATEFKKTDKSILVSPTGPSRVAFNPEQRPLHGVLKTATGSPTGAPLGTKKPLSATPKRRPTAMDFF